MASLVRTMMVMKNWVTGKADIDNDKTRLETNFAMLGFFNSMEQANAQILDNLAHPEVPERFLQKFVKKFKNLLHFSIDVTADFYYFQSFVVTLACLFNLISIPLTIFTEFQEFYHLWLYLSWVTDLVNLLDMFLLSRREYLEDGVKISDLSSMSRNYFKSNFFVVDLLSIFPTDFLFFLFPHIGFIRLNRLLKIHRIFDFLERTEIRTNFPHMFRLVRLIAICIIIFHWNGCFYFIISIVYDYKNAHLEDWIFSYDKIFDVPHPRCDPRWDHLNCSIKESDYDAHNRNLTLQKYADFYENKVDIIRFSNLTKKYSISFYWSALTLTTLGESPQPNNSVQSLFETVDTLIGLIIIAVIVGDVGAMITSLNLTRSLFEEKLDGCKQYMRFRQVHKLLGQKIIQWFEYGWKAGSVKVDEQTIVDCLPPRLKGQLAVHIHMETLQKVALFKECEAGLLYELVLKLKLCIFSPGDFVCQKGDIGKELYIIKKGKLQVVSEDGQQVYVTLEEGKVFGELSILNIRGNKNGNRRTASIKSVGYSDLYVLTKTDLWAVLKEYPDAKKNLMEKGKSILRKDNLLIESNDDGISDLDEEPTTEQRLKYISRQLEFSKTQFDKLSRQIIDSSTTMKKKMTKLENIYVHSVSYERKKHQKMLKI